MGVRAICLANQLAEPHREIGISELIAEVHERAARIVRREMFGLFMKTKFAVPRSRRGKRVEVVTAADEHDCLPPILGLLQVIEQLVGRLEGDVRAMHHFLRRLARRGGLDDFRRLQTAARDPVGRLFHPRSVVGEVDGNRRGSRRDNPEEIFLMNELLSHVAEEAPHAMRVAEVEMQIVDDKNDDAARSVIARARRRQGSMPSQRAWAPRSYVRNRHARRAPA